MDEIIKQLTPATLIVGVVIGMLGNLFFKILDRLLDRPITRFLVGIPAKTRGLLASISEEAKAAQKAEQEALLKRALYLRDHPEKIVELRAIARERKITAMLYYIISSGFFISGSVMLLLIPNNPRLYLNLGIALWGVAIAILMMVVKNFFGWLTLIQFLRIIDPSTDTDNDIRKW